MGFLTIKTSVNVQRAYKNPLTSFARFHINHTFLLRREIMEIFNKVYHISPAQPPSSQDYFRLFMIFSISAVTRFRRSVSNEHPYGYYLAAQNYLSSIPLVRSLDAIQNLLLVARFGMYHHIGTYKMPGERSSLPILTHLGMSLWDISRFCMRQCIEQDLHLQCEPRHSLLQQQHRRRIFWECYILDRYSSGVLGRPFAIADRDITVQLPVNADDETIDNFDQTGNLDDAPVATDSSLTELSVFIFVIELRRITSRIHTDFFDCRNLGTSNGSVTPTWTLSSGDVYVKLYQLLNDLDDWRERAPVFSDPQSLYERPEWYDFMLAKDKLLLARAAMQLAPRRNGHPPKDLLRMSLRHATEIIELYDKMIQLQCITWTRSYFQVIFAAGLSIIYTVSLGVSGDSEVSDKSQGGPALGVTLGLCSKILQMFKKDMPDAGRFAIVFEMLRNNFTRDLNPMQPSHNHRDTINDHIEQATMSALDRPQEHPAPEQTTAGIDLLADVASWPASMDPLPTTNVPAPNPLPPSNFFYGQPAEMADPTNNNETMLEWPTLTDEMMVQLETGLGEYVWDMIDTDFTPWDNVDFGL